MKSRSYRLDEYRITEYGGAALSWEQHAALAEERSGRCFVLGDLLILGPCSGQETGYLSGEFYDRLRELPPWNSTRYYCRASDLLDPISGRQPQLDVLERSASRFRAGDADGKAAAALAPGNYRLARYRIAAGADGNVRWQTYEELQGVTGGRCIMEPGVLFIGPREAEGGDQGRREFSDGLAQLPQLETIVAWGHADVLRTCGEEREKGMQNLRQQSSVAALRVERTALPRAEISQTPPERHYPEAIESFLMSAAERIKAAWKRHSAERVVRQKQGSREQAVVDSRARQEAGTKILPTSYGHYSWQAFRNVLAPAVIPIMNTWQRLGLCKGWVKCAVPIVIAVLLVGAAAAYFLIESWEDSRHSGEHHSRHSD